MTNTKTYNSNCLFFLIKEIRKHGHKKRGFGGWHSFYGFWPHFFVLHLDTGEISEFYPVEHKRQHRPWEFYKVLWFRGKVRTFPSSKEAVEQLKNLLEV